MINRWSSRARRNELAASQVALLENGIAELIATLHEVDDGPVSNGSEQRAAMRIVKSWSTGEIRPYHRRRPMLDYRRPGGGPCRCPSRICSVGACVTRTIRLAESGIPASHDGEAAVGAVVASVLAGRGWAAVARCELTKPDRTNGRTRSVAWRVSLVRAMRSGGDILPPAGRAVADRRVRTGVRAAAQILRQIGHERISLRADVHRSPATLKRRFAATSEGTALSHDRQHRSKARFFANAFAPGRLPRIGAVDHIVRARAGREKRRSSL